MGPGGIAGVSVAGLAGHLLFTFGDQGERFLFFFTFFRPHVEAGARVVFIFVSEVFFGREEDLGAVGGHADVGDVMALGNVIGDAAVNPHIEVARLHLATYIHFPEDCLTMVRFWAVFRPARSGASGGDENV